MSVAMHSSYAKEIETILPEYGTKTKYWRLTIQFRTEEAATSFFWEMPAQWKSCIDRNELEGCAVRLFQDRYSPSRSCNLIDQIQEMIQERPDLRLALNSISTPDLLALEKN